MEYSGSVLLNGNRIRRRRMRNLVLQEKISLPIILRQAQDNLRDRNDRILIPTLLASVPPLKYIYSFSGLIPRSLLRLLECDILKA